MLTVVVNGFFTGLVYGLLAVGWPGVTPKTLPAGEPVTCRYRIWIHRGTPDAAEIQRAYIDYCATARRRRADKEY